MAKVFQNSMVAHVWAQQTQDSGRSNNGQFYFVGPVIYSYGSHFVAGVIDDAGRAWVNADRYSPTTGKHMSYVHRAVRTSFSVPALTGIYRAIQDMGQKGRADWVKREISAYLEKHWEHFAADSQAGAILWAAVSPRGSWKAERARRDAAKAKRSAASAKAAAKYALDRAKEVAAIPLDMVRVRMIQVAGSSNDYRKESDLKSAVATYYEAHKASKPGAMRNACWERLKLAREMSVRLLRHSGKAGAKRRGSIAVLRRIWAGDYFAGPPERAALNLALHEQSAIADLLECHGSPALRAKAHARIFALSEVIERLEIEREAARMAAQAEDRRAWLAGESNRNAYSLKDERGGALLRATGVEMDGCRVIAGDLETSQGASVPLRHAVRVFAFVRQVRESGEAWGAPHVVKAGLPTVIRVGHFQVDRIEATGDFVAGCHNIHWPEVERLARELGLWDCPAIELTGEAESVDV